MDENNDLALNFGKIFPNKAVIVFFALFCISLLFSIFGFFNINFVIVAISQFLSVFSGILLWTLTLSLAISTACAYFKKFKWMFLPIIVWLLFTTAVIRTANIPQLKDITTGNWTLGPDLDPFLYLRLANDINNGSLQNPDMMRYVPLGAKNYAYQSLMPWFIFYFYKISQFFGNDSLTYAAIITPVIFFIISAIGFLLFVKALTSFKFSKEKSWACATIATLFYIFVPSMLHRTVAGVPEIESLGMVWFWFAFLFFILAWKEQRTKKMIVYSIATGIFTGLMSWSWGGYRYIYMILGLTALLIFLFQKERTKNKIIYFSWIIPALFIIYLQIGNIKTIITSINDTGFGIFVLFLLGMDYLLFNTKIKEKIKLEKINLPRPIISLIIGILSIIFVLLIINPEFLINTANNIFGRLLYPFGRERIGLTVAENKVPYFSEILQNFGYLLLIFIIGTLFIFYEAIKKFNLRQKIILNGFFLLFIFGFVFSKYSPTSILNGDSFFSKLIYIGSLLIFALFMLYIIIKAHITNDEKTLQDFKDINIAYILLLAFSFWGIVSMRGAIRLFFIISPIIPLISSFFFIGILNYKNENKQDDLKRIIALFASIILIIIMLGAFINYSTQTFYEAGATSPGVYERQWQQAMSWIRENTPIGSVFVHWWDYGYWIQTIGQRPTVTDGGHFIGYWVHLIGRYVLTSPYPETAFSFMKTHNVSYLLIDSTDLGKYGAYSIIGSNEAGQDRYSQISVMLFDSKQSMETNDSLIRLYQGGMFIDEDIIYNEEGGQIFLPMNRAAIAAVIIEFQKNGSLMPQPKGIFIYNQKQIILPIRYLYENNKLIDFKAGLNATIKIIPIISQDSNQRIQIDKIGTAIYLSPKVSNSLFSQLYLLNDPMNRYKTIKLIYEEPDQIINDLNSQGANLGEFAYFNGFRGPIKIWKVDYPNNTLSKEEFLRTSGGFGEFDNLTFTK